ncbi:hypothetical protein FOCG_08062 [Fusarium oxysporum f. sp. radicis-lycopersici 26381]|nr:hypothetical protein FOCG_08062 [Fusarium oxysporum f. sp. radicis-lycopersici 26381]
MEGERLLEKLWREPTEESLQCLQCQKSFSGSPLIRIFRIAQAGPGRPGSSALVSTSRGDIILFDRHMDCVVWQQQKTVPEAPEVARYVLDILARIYNGIERPGYEARELWLDYISVPQWSDALWSIILPIMDKLFSTAETTVLYFNDVSPNVVNELYKDKRTPERLSSVISVCNSKYFKRIWTAVEFIRSERVRMMISNYTYFPDLDDPASLGQVFKGWKDEVRQYEKVHDLERKVQMGKSQVPWSLVRTGSESANTGPERGLMTQGFSSAAKLALEIDGPDVRDSTAALGRTHPGNVSTSMEILEEKNEVNYLQRVLNKLYSSPEIPSWPTDGKDNITWLGDVLYFSKFRPGDDQTALGDNAARHPSGVKGHHLLRARTSAAFWSPSPPDPGQQYGDGYHSNYAQPMPPQQ